MENTSKALIIAGAILLAILLISAGILVINSTGSVTEETDTTSKTTARRTFNSNFLVYEGTEVEGNQVKALITLIQASNASNGFNTVPNNKQTDRYVYLDNDSENITKIAQIKENITYTVEICAYSQGGYVNIIKITENKGNTLPPPNKEPDDSPNKDTGDPPSQETNTAPTVTTSVSGITVNSAKITAVGKDNDGDVITYTLVIDGKTYGPGATNVWNIVGLKDKTKYTYTVTVTDNKESTTARGEFTTGNNAPALSVSISNETETSLTVKANGSDSDGDTLNYTLTINGKTYGPNTTKSWNITGLSEGSSYYYTVTVTDGHDTTTKTGYAYTVDICDTCGGSR